MKVSKIIASLAAAAVAASAMAFSAFAADPVTVTLDDNYLGDWKLSSGIKREEFDKFDGDVKVVLTVKTEKVKENQYLIKPCDSDKGWDAITFSLTTDKGVCKPDGFMQVKKDQTEVEFVVPASVKNDLWNNGIAFQAYGVTVKSATLSDGSAENDWTIVSDKDTVAYCAGEFDPFAAPAETEAEPEETDAEVTEADETDAEVVEADDEDVEVDDDDTFAVEDDDVVEEAAPVAPVAEPEAAPEVQPVAETAAAVVETAPAADTTATAPVKTGNAAAVSIAFVMVAAGAAAVVSKRK